MELGGASFQDLSSSSNKRTFLSHVFANTEEGKAEVLNVLQYAVMGVIPIVILNKLIQRFIPEVDLDKGSLELLAEIFIQIVVMFGGIILIHRTITYFPTYSGFKYENLILTNVILTFLLVILSIQTKLGLKVSILYDNIMELWEGPDLSSKENVKKGVRINSGTSRHAPSQADYLDSSSVQTNIFPPGPVATSHQESHNYMMPGGGSGGGGGGGGGGYGDYGGMLQPMAANSLLGGSFGSSF